MLSSEDIYEPPRPLKAPSITCDDIELFAGDGDDLFADAGDIVCDDIDLEEKLASDGVYAYVNPIVAVLLGALIADEPLSWRLALAGAVIIAGVVAIVSPTRSGAEA